MPASLLVMASAFLLIVGWFGVAIYTWDAFFRAVMSARWHSDSTCALWDGEIYLTQQRIQFKVGPTGPNQIVAYNPRTGTLRDTDISMTAPAIGLLSDDKRLWMIGSTEIVELDGAGTSRYQPTIQPNAISNPFLLDGRPSLITKETDGRYLLYSLRDRQWNDVGQLALPGPGRTWAFDEQRNQKCLVPRTTGTPPTGTVWEVVRAIQIGDHVHLIANASGPRSVTTAYRRDFDFVPGPDDVPSALAPANSEPDTTGWTELDGRSFNWAATPCNVGQKLMIATTAPNPLWSQVADKPGEFVPEHFNVDLQQQQSLQWLTSASGEQYLVAISRYQTVKIYPWNGRGFDKPPHTLKGIASLLVAVERNSLILAMSVLVLSHLVVLIGAAWLVRRWGDARYSFGHETVMLAPLLRRWLARGIDLAIQFLPLACVILWSLPHFDDEQWLDRQQRLYSDFRMRRFDYILGTVLEILTGEQGVDLFAAGCAWAIVAPLLFVFLQWRFSITPGKLLCGLTTVRTTLRPCGFLRALLRELLLYVDIPLMLTPIPGVVSILLSDNCQRLGDRMADTIVINKRDGNRLSRQPC